MENLGVQGWMHYLSHQEALLYSGVLPSGPSLTAPYLLKYRKTTKTAQVTWPGDGCYSGTCEPM